jgi:hypothetical protein
LAPTLVSGPTFSQAFGVRASYLTFVENERLICDPWNLTVIEPLNCLLCAVAGICQVQDDLPLLKLEWLLAQSDLPAIFLDR